MTPNVHILIIKYFFIKLIIIFLYRNTDNVYHTIIHDNHILRQLNDDGSSYIVAEFKVYPNKPDKRKSPKLLALNNCLHNIYGERDNCGSYDGYEYRLASLSNMYHLLYYEPWRIINKSPVNRCDNYEMAEHEYLRQWSYADYWTLREFDSLQYHIKSTSYELEEFYKKSYGLNQTDANILADCVIKEFIQTLIWAPSDYKRYSLAEIEVPKTDFSKTALMYSIHMNDYSRSKELLIQGANVNARTTVAYRSKRKRINGHVMIFRRSPLMYAAENSSIEIIKLLVQSGGAELDATDSQGRTISNYLKLNPYLTEEEKSLSIKQLVERYSNEAELYHPSFNCKKASTKVEKHICSSKTLSIYDRELTKAYIKLYSMSKTQDFEKKDLLAWQKERKTDCTLSNKEDLDKCLKRKYRAKIRYLQQRLSATEKKPLVRN